MYHTFLKTAMNTMCDVVVVVYCFSFWTSTGPQADMEAEMAAAMKTMEAELRRKMQEMLLRKQREKGRLVSVDRPRRTGVY